MTFALVDGNSFYCSCERAFDPRLKDRPVVVLSNNDGCVISRTTEAKALGIGMGEPWHIAGKRPENRGVAWFSSNYALYADMSRRVFEVLSRFSPSVEPYSIDEMFLDVRGSTLPLPELGARIRAEVLAHAKIPTCVGFGPSKTIAKLANKLAKDDPVSGGVIDLSGAVDRERVYRTWPAASVWGIGKASAERLRRHGAETVAELLRLDPSVIRKELSVVGARIREELAGTSCLPLSMVAVDRKGLAVTRSFGRAVTSWVDMEAAIASFASRAGEKLRESGQSAGHMTVMMRTAEHGRGERCSRQAAFTMEHSNDSLVLVSAAVRAARAMWRDGPEWAKGGVMLADLASASTAPRDLFPTRDPAKSARLMQAFDAINARHGRGAVRSATAASSQAWSPRAARLSPRYTTDLTGIVSARC